MSVMGFMTCMIWVNTPFTDVTGNRPETIVSNGDGWAEFPVNAGSYAVWVEQNQPESNNIDVAFSCFNGYTVMGQDVYVVGDNALMGSWNSDNAVKLSPASYPTWTGTIACNSFTSQYQCIVQVY
jgi:alpha-amylase